MKKETKRYSLVEYCGTIKRYVKHFEEYDELLGVITKFNNRKTCPFYFGNISCKLDWTNYYEVTIHIYNKLTNKMFITDMDNFTMQFENDKELAEYFNGSLRTIDEVNSDINIMYFEDKNSVEKSEKDVDKRIKYIRTLYKEDEEHLHTEYIDRCFDSENRCGNIDFYEQLLAEFSFNPIVEEEVARIEKYINLAKQYSGKDNENVTNYFWECMAVINLYAKRLFHKLIRERNSKKEILRRYYNALCDEKINSTDDTISQRIKLLINELEIDNSIRPVIDVANNTYIETNRPCIAISLDNDKIITGKKTKLLSPASSLILNAIKEITKIPDDVDLLSPSILEPITKYKNKISDNVLNLQELIIALSICSVTNPIVNKALNNLSKLENCDAHASYILEDVDYYALKNLKINITCEPIFKPKD